MALLAVALTTVAHTAAPATAAPAEGRILVAPGSTAVTDGYLVVLREGAVRASGRERRTAVERTAESLAARFGHHRHPVPALA